MRASARLGVPTWAQLSILLLATSCGDQTDGVQSVAGGPGHSAAGHSSAASDKADAGTTADPVSSNSVLAAASSAANSAGPSTSVSGGGQSSASVILSPVAPSNATQPNNAVSATPATTASALPSAVSSSVASGSATSVTPPNVVPQQYQGCFSTEQHDDTNCAASYVCEQPTQGQCYSLNDGIWRCYCGDATAVYNFELQGVDGSNACQVGLGFCAQLATATGPIVCEDPVTTSTTESCRMDRVCAQTVELSNAPGVSALLRHDSWDDCTSGPSGNPVCACYTPLLFAGVGGTSFTLPGSTLATACESGISVCDTDPKSVDGPTVCQPATGTSDATSCDRYKACGNTQELSSGLTAEYRTTLYSSSCKLESGASGMWDCWCESPGRSQRLKLDPAEQLADPCEFTERACAEEVTYVATEDFTCSSTQALYIGSCDASLYCFQPATFGEQSILIPGNAAIRCEQDADTQTAWNCGCDSTIGDPHFVVTAQDEAAACASAATTCESQLEFGASTLDGKTTYGLGIPDVSTTAP